MQAELGQAGELLGDGELHVMAGDALVVGGGLVVDQAAVGEVGGGDDDAAGALAVGGSGLVVGGHGGLEGGDGLDRDRGAGDDGEELGQLGLHLRDVAAEVVEDLVGGGGDVLGVGLERFAEAGEVVEAFLMRDDEHLGLDAGDLLAGRSRGSARG